MCPVYILRQHISALHRSRWCCCNRPCDHVCSHVIAQLIVERQTPRGQISTLKIERHVSIGVEDRQCRTVQSHVLILHARQDLAVWRTHEIVYALGVFDANAVDAETGPWPVGESPLNVVEGGV